MTPDWLHRFCLRYGEKMGARQKKGGDNNPDLKGFNRRGLYRMKQFYELYKDNEKVSPLVTQLSWTYRKQYCLNMIKGVKKETYENVTLENKEK